MDDETLRFQTALQSISDAIVWVDAAGLVSSLNPAAERLLLCSDEAARGRPLRELCRFIENDDQCESDIDLLAAVRERPWPFAFARTLQIKVAARPLLPVEVLCRSVSGPMGASADVLLVVRDVSERRALQHLRESERHLHFALESLGIGEWEVDLTTGAARTSRAHDRCFGAEGPLQDWSVDKFLSYVHPQDRDELRRKVRAAYKAQQDCRFQCRLVWPDGSVHWIEAHWTIDDAKQGKPTYAAGLSRDITEQKNAERLRESYTTSSEFLANVVHDIRSPMASVMGYAELLATRLTDPADREYLKIIKNSGDQLLTLCTDLLDLAKLDAGTLELIPAPVALARLLDDVQASMHSRGREKGLRLCLRLDGSVPEIVEADLRRMRQVLVGLIGLAINFTEHGDVDWIVRHDGDRVMNVEIACATVDNAPEGQRPVLDSFSSSADPAGFMRHGRNELSLAFTSRLVQLMGGTLTFQNDADGVNRFRVSFPAPIIGARPTPVATPDSRAQGVSDPAQTPAKLKILLIDDNRVTCKSMGMLLEMAGHDVRVAYNGHGALAVAKEFCPRVVISDIKLPDMGGFDLMRELRLFDGMEKTKFIALSGYAENDFHGEKLKFHHFLQKPVKLNQLELLLSDCVADPVS